MVLPGLLQWPVLEWAGIPNEYGDSYITLEQFLNFTFSNRDKDVSEVFHFYSKTMMLAEIFGRENVFVFPIEKLKTDPSLFVGELSKVLGVDNDIAFDLMNGKVENRRNTGNMSMYRFETKIGSLMGVPVVGNVLRHVYFERMARKLIYKFAQYEVSLSTDWEKKLADIYKDGNRKISAEFDLGLSKYQYPI